MSNVKGFTPVRFLGRGACCAMLGLLAGHTFGETTPPLPTQEITIEAKQKIQHKWKPRPSRVLLGSSGETIKPDSRNVYGGLQGVQGTGTGFFRTERDSNGVWWLLDPDGRPFISVGLNAVRPSEAKRSRERRGRADTQEWANQTTRLLRDSGFNTLGGWSDLESMRAGERRIPYTDVLNFMARYSTKAGQSKQGSGHRDYPDDMIPVFDPAFEKFCHQEAKKLAERQNDQWLIGYFSDNEMPFPDDALDRFLRRTETDPGHVAAQQWLADHKLEAASIDKDARAKFLNEMADRYFKICNAAIKENDPNHLYLGTRFHAKVLWNEPVIRAAGKHVDVVSINWYGQWTPDRETMDGWLAWTGKPFLISEFFAKGMDSGLPNSSGAGWIVKTQKDRAGFYQNFVLPLVLHPGCVGWHWFRYMDNDPDQTPTDPTNRDANKGIVDARFKPYTELLEGMTLLNQRVYHLRGRALSLGSRGN